MLTKLIIFLFQLKSLLTLSFNLEQNEMIHDITLDSYVTLFENQHFNLPIIQLCFGTPNSQCFNLALSTTLQDLILESSFSKGKHFNQQYNSSDSFSYFNAKFRRTMGFPLLDNKEYYLFGEETRDFIHFPNSKYLKQPLTFVLIESAHTTTHINLDGFLGLKISDPLIESKNNFLNCLNDNNLISSKTFALSYYQNGSGIASFGEDWSQYDYCNLTQKSKDTTKWQCELNRLTIDNLNITLQNKIIQFDSVKNAVIASLDTGMLIFEYIINNTSTSCRYIRDKNCFVLLCHVSTRIDLFYDIHLYMNKVEIVIKWSNLFRLANINGTKVLLSSFLVNTVVEEDYWIIGIPGFIDNTIVFELNEMKVRIIQASNAEGFKVFETVNIFIAILIILFFGVCFIIYVKYNLVIK